MVSNPIVAAMLKERAAYNKKNKITEVIKTQVIETIGLDPLQKS